MRTFKGSNQFQKKYPWHKVHPFIYIGIIIVLLEVAVGHEFKKWEESKVITPCPDFCRDVKVQAAEFDYALLTPTPTPTPRPTKENVTGYIGKVFGQTSMYAVGQATMCFVTEGMRDGSKTEVDTRAVGYNCMYEDKNGKPYSTACKIEDRPKAWSVDCGVAQINVKGQVCPEELFDYQKNIDIAYQKFLDWGKTFGAWFGMGCK